MKVGTLSHLESLLQIMDTKLLSIFLMLLVILGIVLGKKRRYGVMNDVFCDDASLRQIAVLDSGLQCTRECHNDLNCVAFSQQNSHCILHSDFCGIGNFKAQPGALYTGKS